MNAPPQSPPLVHHDPGDHAGDGYTLTLFVSGASERSGRAIANATTLCDRFPPGRCRFSVVDINDNRAAVLGAGVVAVPTLVKELPLPVCRVVGDLSDADRVLLALGISGAVVPLKQKR